MSEKEKEILEIIEKFIDENGYSPTVREIGALSGLKSTSSVHGHIKRLNVKGLLTKGEEGMPRSITIKKEIRNIKLVVNTIALTREFNKEYILLEKVAGQHKDNSNEGIFELPNKNIEDGRDIYKVIRETLDYYGIEIIKIYGETLRNGLCNSGKVKAYKPFSTTQSIEDGQLTIYNTILCEVKEGHVKEDNDLASLTKVSIEELKDIIYNKKESITSESLAALRLFYKSEKKAC